jgi:acyl-CoA thioesterase
MDKPTRIVDMMYENDKFSQWLGIERVLIEEGRAILKMVIRKEMLNGFDIAHGGIVFSLADSAFAFSSNSFGKKSVSIEASVNWTKALYENDEIVAESKMRSISNKQAVFDIDVKRGEEIVAIFRGIVYRTSKDWIEEV